MDSHCHNMPDYRTGVRRLFPYLFCPWRILFHNSVIYRSPIWTQILVFAICSVLSIIFVRPSLLRKLHNRQERLSNSDALIGREGRVIEAICPGDYGYVKIDGDEWKAQSPDDTTIEVGTTVKVIGRESIIISVERVQTSTYNNNQPT